jgi:ribonuclease PH
MRLRPLHIETPCSRYADGSAIFSMGFTRVHCTASIETQVPAWLRDKKQGWVSAEYAMLPRATHTRTKRERPSASGRSHEIQRLVGRALRSAVSLTDIPDTQILVDCDVLQADGGTRTSAINGGFLALATALRPLEEKKNRRLIKDTVVALSLGLVDGIPEIDLCYEQDSKADVDGHIVVLGTDKILDIHLSGEAGSMEEESLQNLVKAGLSHIQSIREVMLGYWQPFQPKE